jgi:hypothetical protein
MKTQKVVYIVWEGRGYEYDSWEKDKSETMKLLGNPKEIFVAAFDVGLLVGTHPFKAKDKPEMFETRHGRSSASCLSMEDIFTNEDRGEWEKFSTFADVETEHKEWF